MNEETGKIGYGQCSTCGAINNACGCPLIIMKNGESHYPDACIGNIGYKTIAPQAKIHIVIENWKDFFIAPYVIIKYLIKKITK